MRLLLFADIHIGNIKDTDYIYNTIIDIVDKEVLYKKTDVIVILGDYFDRLFKANEEYVALAINVMSYIVRTCIKCKTKIRIIYGTESHEMNQYKLFNYFISSNKVDMKVFDTVTEEIINDKHILYVPEEYIENKQKFYEPFFHKKYDYIFGHGIIEDGMPGIVSYSANSNKNNEKQVPRFKSGEFSEISKLTVFGHYHVFSEIKPNVYYLGSLFRNCFGEETPKYYGVIEDNKISFIENDKAYEYKTYEYNETSHIFDSSDELLNEISKIKNINKNIFNGDRIGKIRIIFKPPINIDPSFKENLKNILFNDRLISSLIKEQSNEIVDDIKEDISDEYEYVIDNNLSAIDKIHTWINKQYSYQISLEDLTKDINEPLLI